MKYISLCSSFLFLSAIGFFCDGMHLQTPSRKPSIRNETDIIKAIGMRPGQHKKPNTPDKLGEHEVFNHSKRPQVPVINMVAVRDTHFDAFVALAHWFSGYDLPYHAKIPNNVQEILRNARLNDSEVYVNSFADSDFVTSSDHRNILLNQMKDDHIRYGYHMDPDLRVIFSIYPDLHFFKLAAQNDWCNNTNILFIVEDFGHTFRPEELDDVEFNGSITDDFMDLYRWDNVIGLVPTVPKYVIPSYFPSRGRRDPPEKKSVTTFCVEGNFEEGHDFFALQRVLYTLRWGCKWDIKLNGDGHFPYQLNKYRDKVELLRMDAVALNDFFDYECHYLLPLVSNTTVLGAFQTKLQTTVTRALGYKLPVVGWEGLKQMYPMVDGYFYNDDISFKYAMEEAMNCTK